MEKTIETITAGIKPFEEKVWLSSPTMHGEELKYIEEAYNTNWMSTVGANIDAVEKELSELIGRKYTVALSSGTAALHLAIKRAGEKLYGQPAPGHGCLEGHRVICSDMTFAATVNPVCYEGGECVFVDTEYDTWNMDPSSLEKAFRECPDVKMVVLVHLYGTPAKMDEIRSICDAHHALLVEDAAESLGATYKGKQTGLFGNDAVLSMNGNKIITGTVGGFYLTDDEEAAKQIKKWSTQSREPAPWYQHEEIGYNYRMSNIVAGVIRGQLHHLHEHIEQKRTVYERYKEGFKDLPVQMSPYDEDIMVPNFWLSCLLIDEDAMCQMERSDLESTYVSETGKSCPTQILEAIAAINAEGRPIWKPMHMQPIYRNNKFVKAGENDAGADIFRRGLCLPSDNKMTSNQQDRIIEIIHRCFFDS